MESCALPQPNEPWDCHHYYSRRNIQDGNSATLMMEFADCRLYEGQWLSALVSSNRSNVLPLPSKQRSQPIPLSDETSDCPSLIMQSIWLSSMSYSISLHNSRRARPCYTSLLFWNALLCSHAHCPHHCISPLDPSLYSKLAQSLQPVSLNTPILMPEHLILFLKNPNIFCP